MDEDRNGPLEEADTDKPGQENAQDRHFSVTSRIDALRTTKETTDYNEFIGEAFPLKSK